MRKPEFTALFAPVFNADATYSRQEALQMLAWFMVDSEGYFKTDFTIKAVSNLLGLADEDYLVDNNSEEWRAAALKLFAHLALIMASVDQGKLLAGFMGALMKTTGAEALSK